MGRCEVIGLLFWLWASPLEVTTCNSPNFLAKAIRSHSFMTSAKRQWLRPLLPAIHNHPILVWLFPFPMELFCDFSSKFNKKINILAYKFFTLLIRKLFAILINIIKLTGKRTELNQAHFYERLMYLHCLHYRTAN